MQARLPIEIIDEIFCFTDFQTCHANSNRSGQLFFIQKICDEKNVSASTNHLKKIAGITEEEYLDTILYCLDVLIRFDMNKYKTKLTKMQNSWTVLFQKKRNVDQHNNKCIPKECIIVAFILYGIDYNGGSSYKFNLSRKAYVEFEKWI